MNLDELRTVQSKERRKDSLQHLRDSFYGDVAAYVEGLKEERKRIAAEADDPFSSPEVGRLTDEIETAEEVVEAVYERRVGKVVKLASFAAADMPVDDDGMTAEERALFDDLVERIERNKSNVLDVLAGERRSAAADAEGGTDDSGTPEAPGGVPASESAASDADSIDEPGADRGGEPGTERPDSGGVLADAMGGGPDDPGSKTDDGDGRVPDGSDAASAGDAPDGPAGDGHEPRSGAPEPDDRAEDASRSAGDGASRSAGGDASPNADGTDRTTVRITADVGEIFGVDEREYYLEAEDVVTLPTANAEPLVERDAAERLD
ncbi:DNA replication complex subunit Gins51 [Halegenticoccus soli]|uniref:DNA replication complex subunit Gins51 n=1 Tax=Halegenticoccus soli TaxID=1985678 RepID=UPI000C6E5B83|nr:hypothetical protein [Halegenticoccus soli]